MSERKIPLVLGEFHHVYNRGNSKQNIFRDSNDYARFQQMLYVMNSVSSVTFRLIEKEEMYKYDRGELLVHIGAYCLMPNHFHILLTPVIEKGVQLFMQKISTGYSMYFNKKYERTGGLFEGRFKSQYADTDEYLKYLFAYIHLNPLKLLEPDWKEKGIQNISGAKTYLNKYLFSSYLDFCRDKRNEEKILNIDTFPEYFPTSKSCLQEIQDWIAFKAGP